MYLKSLTLKGFKSFASATTLRFEPGITAVVGPNGSGKSNVVDALSWVMGEQGAKSLRGGKMEDVIFAGTAGRAPLGRAEVSLTIDNTDGALPIDYTEVTISRILFRNGTSEYAINGENARLLDVQELLSDSGIGREMHVIVGQGQLDSVLSATPEDRRGFIEEAAGVLKHRKRKEKALRKLEAMQMNLTRVQDLVTELRRQLKPLGKQAEAARKAAVIQADLRDARLRLYADDLIQMRATLEAEVADETALRQRRTEVEQTLASNLARETELEELAAVEAPLLAQFQETYYRLTSLKERYRGTADLAAERTRFLSEEAEEARAAGRDPEAMEAEALLLREEESRLIEQIASHSAELARTESQRLEREDALRREEASVSAAVRAAADRREGLARLRGEVGALKSKVDAAQSEVARLESSREEALNRARAAQSEFALFESQVAGMDQGEQSLDAEYETANSKLIEASARVDQLRDEERRADRDRAAHDARLEALRMGSASKDGSSVLLQSQLRGMLGSLADLIVVEPGWQAAISAALGEAANALAVTDIETVASAIDHLKNVDGGSANFILGGASPLVSRAQWPTISSDAKYAIDVVRSSADISGALAALLEGMVLVESLQQAKSIKSSHPELTVITRAGDVIGPLRARGGSGKQASLIEVRAAIDETTALLEEATHRGERVRFDLARALEIQLEAQSATDAAMARLHESDAQMAALAEQMSLAGQAVRSANAEATRIESAIADVRNSLAADQSECAQLESRLAQAENLPIENEPDVTLLENLRNSVAQARANEMDARLALRTGEERAHSAGQRAEQLERNAQAEREARATAVKRREARAIGAVTARAVMVLAQEALSALDISIAQAASERAQAESARTAREADLLGVRQRGRELSQELEQLTSSVHRDEVARAEYRLRIESLEQKVLEEMGVDASTLLADYGPENEVPTFVENEQGEFIPGPLVPYDREAQEKRLRTAERALALLGKVNPLALEEYAALEERAKFLGEQLEDLKKTRHDLMEIVREVDERVEQIFTEAFRDTAREFEGVFSRLFPGGEGRLVLTNPDDMLTTGIEVEARPPGKKIKRLSLLSGGERSLTAVALLVAIFKARPSPFYVLDEVEAALDDTNLGRLIGLMEELRGSSQLLIITHQKKTMEIADALYGVTMRGDGVTEVISQRLRDLDSESEPVGV